MPHAFALSVVFASLATGWTFAAPSVEIVDVGRADEDSPLTVEVALSGMSGGEWLYLTHDAADRGEGTNGWAVVRKFTVGTDLPLVGGTLSLPEVQGAKGVVRALVQLGDAGDEPPEWGTPIDYLEVTDATKDGDQYFDTGHALTTGDAYEMKMRTATLSGSSTTWFLMGASSGGSSGTDDRSTVFYCYQGKWYFAINATKSTTGVSVAKDTEYLLRSTFQYGSQTFDYSTGGPDAYQNGMSFTVTDDPKCSDTLLVFRRNVNGRARSSSSYPAPVGTRLYWLKISHDGELVNDYVPCLHPESKRPCLYDRKGGGYLLNQGSADFAYAGGGDSRDSVIARSPAVRWRIEHGGEGYSKAKASILSVEPGGDGTTLSVHVSFSDVLGGERLYLVHDISDHGENVGNWKLSADMGVLAKGVTEGTYELSVARGTAGGVVRAIIQRGTAGSDPDWGTPLAYLATAGGTPFVNTGHILALGDVCEARMRTAPGTLPSEWFLMGAYATSSKYRSNVYHYYNSHWCIGVNDKYEATPKVKATPDADYRLTATFDLDRGSCLTIDCYTGLPQTVSTTISKDLQNTNIPLCVFARNANCAQGAAKITVDKPSPTGTRLYALSISRGGFVVHDYVPCLDLDGIPCFYDRETEDYLYDESSDGVLVGPDPSETVISASPTVAWGTPPPDYPVAEADVFDDYIKYTTNGLVVVLSGFIKKTGGGFTEVALEWGYDKDRLDHVLPLSDLDMPAGQEHYITGCLSLPVKTNAYCRFTSRNTVSAGGVGAAFTAASKVLTLSNVGGQRGAVIFLK